MKVRKKDSDSDDPRALTRQLLDGGEFLLWVPETDIDAPYRCRTLEEADHFAERVIEVYGQLDGNLWMDHRDRVA